VMEKVRERVRNDRHLDESIDADLEQGRADRIMRTPSVMLAIKGERREAGGGAYNPLKTMLDHFLARP